MFCTAPTQWTVLLEQPEPSFICKFSIKAGEQGGQQQPEYATKISSPPLMMSALGVRAWLGLRASAGRREREEEEEQEEVGETTGTIYFRLSGRVIDSFSAKGPQTDQQTSVQLKAGCDLQLSAERSPLAFAPEIDQNLVFNVIAPHR